MIKFLDKIFKKNKSKDEDNDKDTSKDDNKHIYKNKKLSGNVVKVKVSRFFNGTPVEIRVFTGELMRDENNNTIIFNEDELFKEEMPGVQDTLISDILYKLKSRSNSKEEQLKQIDIAIKQQETIIKNETNGFIKKKEKEIDKETGKEKTVEKKIKINLQTERSKLRILKCSKYALDNKEGEGFFESIDIDGNRTLSYALIDGELIPYWFKTPTSKGEPICVVPDVVGRKKFYKESETEAIQDFNESVDWFWKGWLNVAMKLLTVVWFAGLIFWTVSLAGWNSDLYDDSLEPRIQELQLENQKIQQRCNQGLAQQMENNNEVFDYAIAKMAEETSKPPPPDGNVDKSNIKI